MKKTLFIALSLAYGLPMTAQSLPDSTDMFFRHLELKEVTVTGAVGDMRMKETPMPIVVLQASRAYHKSPREAASQSPSFVGWAITALWLSTTASDKKDSSGATSMA